MTIKRHTYRNDVIEVSFDGGKCAHAGVCFQELGEVFDGDADPPIDLSAAPVDEIARVVEACPSSALTYRRFDDVEQEAPDKQVVGYLLPNGPLALRGQLTIQDQRFFRLTLCRCGQSKQKPYCDGSHKQHKFDIGTTFEVEEVEETHLRGMAAFSMAKDGPLIFDGNIRFKTMEGHDICRRSSGFICRCGASESKPFCDGSHKKVGFKSK